jgi:hypothetical protein
MRIYTSHSIFEVRFGAYTLLLDDSLVVMKDLSLSNSLQHYVSAIHLCRSSDILLSQCAVVISSA